MRLFTDWSKYGFCNKCLALAQEKCIGRFRLWACKGRESYERYCNRYATILTVHNQYTVLPEEIPQIERTEIEKHGKA